MPTIRKIDRPVDWERELEREHLADVPAFLAARGVTDATGLTRVEYSRTWGWYARVYVRGVQLARGFADGRYGSPQAALLAALRWRDSARTQFPRPAKKGFTWRVQRVEYERAYGYLAYADRRRFFSANKYGGWGGAKEAAEAWLVERRAGLKTA